MFHFHFGWNRILFGGITNLRERLGHEEEVKKVHMSQESKISVKNLMT